MNTKRKTIKTFRFYLILYLFVSVSNAKYVLLIKTFKTVVLYVLNYKNNFPFRVIKKYTSNKTLKMIMNLF